MITTFTFLLILAGITFVLKIIPVLYDVKEKKKTRNKMIDDIILSAEYSVCFIMGYIIYNITYKKSGIDELLNNFNFHSLLCLLSLIIAYFLSTKTGSAIIALVCGGIFFEMGLIIYTM